MIVWIVGGIVAVGIVGLAMSIRIVRPTERGLKERFGKYHSYIKPGINYFVPFVDKLVRVNVTEQMVDAKKQDVITKDNLNAGVDAQVYFKVLCSEDAVRNSEYNVDNYYIQIVALARTTLRDIIGKLSFKEVNGMRAKLNGMLQTELNKETKSWGIAVVRTELKEIEPPSSVQETMNEIIKAENTKEAAVDFAVSVETKADGEKKATIKQAQGAAEAVKLKAIAEKNANIEIATGKAEAIKLVNESAEKYFVGNAVELKKLETMRDTLASNTKIIIPKDAPIVDFFAKMAAMKEVKEK